MSNTSNNDFDSFIKNAAAPAAKPSSPAPAPQPAAGFDDFLTQAAAKRPKPAAVAAPAASSGFQVSPSVPQPQAQPQTQPPPASHGPVTGSSLTNVIEIFGAKAPSQRWGPGEILISYDPKDRSVAPHEARNIIFRNLPGKSFEFFLVKDAGRAALDPFSVAVLDSTQHPREIACTFVIQGVTAGKEKLLVENLIHISSNQIAKNMTDLLNNLQRQVAAWINEYVIFERNTSGADICRAINDVQRTACSAYLAKRAQEVLGLSAICGVSLPTQDNRIPPIHFRLDPISLLDDPPDRLALDCEINLEPSDLQLAARVRLPHAAITQTLQHEVRHWLMTRCHLVTFCFDRLGLQQSLSAFLQSYVSTQMGQKLVKLVVTPEFWFPRQFDIGTIYKSTGHVNPGHHPLEVNHTLVVELADIAKMLANGPRPGPSVLATRDIKTITDSWNKELESWTQKLLDQTTRQCLAGRQYTDVGLRFHVVAAAIKKRVEAEFLRIGFKADQFVTLPGDKQIEACLSGNFTFATKEILCQTSESKVNYCLSAQVRFAVKNLTTIQSYLLPGKSLEDEFIQETTQVITNTVREISPEALYLGFDRAFVPQATPGLPTVKGASPEKRISGEIEARLKSKFGASDFVITLRPEQSVVTRLDDALRQASDRCCEVKLFSVGNAGEELRFFVYYRVVAIASGGWFQFQALCRSIQNDDITAKAKEVGDAMDDKIAAESRIKIRGMPPQLILCPDDRMQEILVNHGPQKAVQEIRDNFGLTVMVTRIDRGDTLSEARVRAFNEAEYDDALEDHRRLVTKIRELEDAHGRDHPQIEELRQQLKDAKALIRSLSSTHGDYLKDAPKTLNSLQWEARYNLPARAQPPEPPSPPAP